MGAGESDGLKEDGLHEVISKMYQSVKVVDHPVMGRIFIHSTSSVVAHPIIFNLDLYETSKEGAQKTLRDVSRRAEKRPDYFLKQLGSRYIRHSNMCSDSHAVRVFFQYIQENLLSRMLEVKGRGEWMPESQVVGLMRTLFTCLKEQHERCTFVGNLTAEHILLGKHFRLKVIDRDAIQKDMPNSENMNIRSGYTDPQLIRCMFHKHTQMNGFDPFKADIWTAGLIIWEAMTLERSISLYDYRALKVNKNRLVVQLDKAEAVYPPKHVNLVRSMLHFDPIDRVTAAELLLRFSP